MLCQALSRVRVEGEVERATGIEIREREVSVPAAKVERSVAERGRRNGVSAESGRVVEDVALNW